MTTGTCLYDIEEYGIIPEIMACSIQKEKASLSSITSMSMVVHVLSRLSYNKAIKYLINILLKVKYLLDNNVSYHLD